MFHAEITLKNLSFPGYKKLIVKGKSSLRTFRSQNKITCGEFHMEDLKLVFYV